MKWIQLDLINSNSRHYIDVDIHNIYYLRHYISRGGYQASETNDLISNFKKNPNSSSAVIQYKKGAIDKFSLELSSIFKHDFNYPACMSWIPTSCAKTDPNYDNRLEQVVNNVCKNIKISPIEAFITIESKQSFHSNAERKESSIKNSIIWNQNISLSNYDIIFIIDDVLITGLSFKTIHDLIKERYPNIFVYGLIWAITIR
jgi:predicted amidophosphoribosyltransferase